MRVLKSERTTRRGGPLRMTLAFDREDLTLVDTPYGVVIELAGAANSGEPGGPGLPARLVRVALPPMSEVRRVRAEALETVSLVDEPVLIAPLQHPRAGVKDNEPPTQGPPTVLKRLDDEQQFPIREALQRAPSEPFEEPFPAPPLELPRRELYEREFKAPRPLARLVATEPYGLVPVAVIEVNPVQLNEDHLLALHTQIELTVSYRSQSSQEMFAAADLDQMAVAPVKTIHSRTQAQRIIDLARAEVVNPEAVADFSPIFPTLFLEVDYLIITDNQTWDAEAITPTGDIGDLVAAFQELAAWKAKRGLRTRVVTISQIVGGTYGNFRAGARDLQEVIRNFLKWAHSAWGVSWVLLGGDVSVVPVRRVAGASEGHIREQTDDNPPPNNKSFWAGSYLRMKVVNPGVWWPGSRTDHLLVRPDTGMLIPYDPSGSSGPTQLGWYFTTNDSYNVRSTTPTQFVRVNGPESQIRTTLQWLYQWNMLPTDLYYASLTAPTYNQPGKHDWDLLDNGVYGQHTNDADLDGVSYAPDISVGRAPVASPAQASAFVAKVRAYEQFRRPDGTALEADWPRRLLMVSSNWGGRVHISQTSASPPTDNRYHHTSGQAHSLIKLKNQPEDLKWRLIARVTTADLRVMPYNRSAGAGSRGWHYAVSATDLSVSEISFTILGTTFHFPKPTEWVVVYGPSAELTPDRYIFDRTDPDGSMRDQEQLREQVETELPRVDTIARLYEDEVDLTPAQAAAAPIAHLTSDRLRDALNAGQHFVSLSGHGSSNGCCGLDGAMAAGLLNGLHSSIGYADSCLTNQFDAEDAVSERLLYNPNGGAVGYIGNTRFSWIGVGDNFQRKFFNRLTSTRHLGLANDTRGNMVNEPTGFYRLYNKWAIFTLNLMGDPETPVWIGRPRTMKVAFPRVVDKRLPFTVKVERRFLFVDLPLAGAVVHIQQGSFSRQAVTGGNGRATFDLNPAELGELEVTVTRSGYRPFLGEARITGPAWVSGQVTAVWHQHRNPHHSLVRLHLSQAIDGDAHRGWYARDSHPDYQVILDAATDAYVSEKPISLFVNNTDEGGTIEKFRFGHRVLVIAEDLDLSPVRARERLVPQAGVEVAEEAAEEEE